MTVHNNELTADDDSTVIIGGGLGGVRVAAELRELGYRGTITVISAEVHLPYDRPPLSKNVLREEDSVVELYPAEFYAEQRIKLLLETKVVAVNTSASEIELSCAGITQTMQFSNLVIATGLTARQLPGTENITGIEVLRTLDDVRAIQAQLASATRTVVIGAGFIGCEVAASLMSLGHQVEVIEPESVPLLRALGPTIGALVQRLHEERGVQIHTGVGVTGFRSKVEGVSDATLPGVKYIEAVELSDGRTISADLVIVGVGSNPNTELAEAAGIVLAERSSGGGILCSAAGLTSAKNVYAVGDVANWPDMDGHRQRVEHWNNVVEQAIIVARTLTGTTESASSQPAVPYFWSDQYDIKFQALGHPSGTDDVTVISDDGTKFVAYYSREGILTAVVGAGKAGAVMKMRAKIAARTPISEVLT